MISYDLTISRGHLIIELSDGMYLIDTGSPSSFGPNEKILFADKNYYSVPLMRGMARIDEMSQFIGTKIVGLIGCDILMNYCFILDLVDKVMTVSNQSYLNDGKSQLETSMKLLQGLPLIDIEINQSQKAFIDTGATISYICKKYTEGMVPIREEKDAHPMVGNFTTNIFNFDIKIEGRTFNIEFGVLPPILEQMFAMFGADAVIGYDLIKDKIIIFDYFSKKFILK